MPGLKANELKIAKMLVSAVRATSLANSQYYALGQPAEIFLDFLGQ